jgi:hypothetical protein
LIKGQVSGGPGIEHALAYIEERDVDPLAGLLGLQRDDPVADAMLADGGSVTATQAGIHIDVEHDALARADRPVFLVPEDLVVGPLLEPAG